LILLNVVSVYRPEAIVVSSVK